MRHRRLPRPSPLALASARISEVDEEEANGTDDEEVRQGADEVVDPPRFLNNNVQSSRSLKPRPSSVPHPPRVRRHLSVTESTTRRPQHAALSSPTSPVDDEVSPRRRRPTSACPSSLADQESWYTNNAYASTPQFTRLGLRGSSVVLPESAKAYAARKKKEEQKARQANVADAPAVVAPTSPSQKLSVNASATSSSTSPSSTASLSTRPPREHPPTPPRNKPPPLPHSQPSSSRKMFSFLSVPLSRRGAGGSTTAPLSSEQRRASSPSASVSDSSSSITIVTSTSPSSASTHSAADSESLSAVSVKATSVASTAGSDAETGADIVGKVGKVACDLSPASERVLLSKGGKKTRWVILNLVR